MSFATHDHISTKSTSSVLIILKAMKRKKKELGRHR
jgi:hypothetical protein